MRAPRTACKESGFTVVEVMVAVVILVVGLLGTVALIDHANATTGTTKKREAATNLARQVVEGARKSSYVSLNSTSVAATLQLQPGLADVDASAPGWQLDSRGTRFTVTASLCSVDDPKDGLGVTHSATLTWCSSYATGSDNEPEDFKRVTITVTAPAGSEVQPVTQTAIISRGTSNSLPSGSGPGTGLGVISCGGSALITEPALGACSARAWNVYGSVARCTHFGTTAPAGETACTPSATYAGTTPPITSINFRATFSEGPASVKWALDGNNQGTATADLTDNRVWTFTWDLADTYPNQTVDGPYDLTAQGYDVDGRPLGDPLRAHVQLNRFIPDLAAYQAPTAGRNPLWSNLVEIEWWPSPPTTTARLDRDWNGFRVNRYCCKSTTQNYAATPCVTSNNWCTESYAKKGSEFITYGMTVQSPSPDGSAYNRTTDTTGGAGGPGNTGNVNVNGNNAPTAPTNLTAVTSANSTVTLSWTMGADSDTGDCAESYRIYRTPTSQAAPTVGDRYDRAWPATCGATGTLSWVDENPGGVTHNYWVTTVDTHLAESSLTGPVVR
jgi:type II secretory pathway pseudopilin PulG